MVEKILIVEDEKEIADLIKLYLAVEKYEVMVAYTGEEALDLLKKETPDLAILDIMLPDMCGFDICRQIRGSNKCPILFLTAKDSELEKIQGLNCGADDYITKPFKPLELVARVKANLRRYIEYNDNTLKTAQQTFIQFEGMTLNCNSYDVTIDTQKIDLTPKEFNILLLLLSNRGVVINSEVIFQNVWEEKYYDTSNNTVMVHIRHIRQKMKKQEGEKGYIKTVWGVGYVIDA